MTKQTKEISELKNSKNKTEECIVCGEKAEYCMRGLPKNTYCETCAEDYFKMLEYLDKLDNRNSII